MARRRSRLNQRRSNLLRDDLYSYLLAGGIRPEAAHYIDAHIGEIDDKTDSLEESLRQELSRLSERVRSLELQAQSLYSTSLAEIVALLKMGRHE